jgi:zinc protease
MKRIITIVFLCLTFTFSVYAQSNQQTPDAAKPSKLPTVDQIIEKSINAAGGRAAIEKITSRVMKGTLEIAAMGLKGSTEAYTKAPNKTLNLTTIGGIGQFKQGYDGKIAWAEDPVQGLRELTGAELALVKRDSEMMGELKFKQLYPKSVVKGTGKVGLRDAYIVEATPTEGGPETFYFDAETGLLLRRDFVLESAQGTFPTESYLEDYKKVDGIMIPHTVRQTTPVTSFIIKITEVTHNVPIDDAKFVKPSGQ